MKIKSFLNSIWFFVVHKIILGKRFSILMYHSVGKGKEFHVVDPVEFEWQMKHLKDKGFKVVPLENILDEKDKKAIAITFDDGYEDNFLKAFPVLRKFSFPATVFLTTANIGNKDYVNSRGVHLPMLDWSQIRAMHDSGLIDFEPHTVSHPRLSSLGPEDAKKEMADSKEEIEKMLNKTCNIFAYPFGDYNKSAVAEAREIFKMAVIVDRGFVGKGDDPLLLKRNSIDASTTRSIFRMKV